MGQCKVALVLVAVVSCLEVASKARADLVHHWEFEDDFTDSAGDLEGVAFGNAMITGDARIGDGALDVGGGGDHVEVPNDATLQFSAADSYSVTAWVRASASSGWRGVVTKGREAAPWYGIWINPGSRWVYGTNGNNLAGSGVQFDAWVHVAIVQDGDLGTRDLYVDGAIVASELARDALSPAPLFIGGAGGVNEWFVGQIDEVRVYDEALEEEDVIESMGCDVGDGADTHRRGVALTDPDGNAVSAGGTHPSGTFAVEVEADDDSGDPIRYRLTADNGVDPPTLLTSSDGRFQLRLRIGTWTVSVTVDDDRLCDELAADAVCAVDAFTVESAAARLIHRWEFEDDFTDSVGNLEGVPFGNAMITDDARIGDGALGVGGGGDHLEVLNDATLQFSAADSYSVTAWVKASASSGWRGVVTKGREAAPWYGIWINPGSRWVYGTNGNNLAGSGVQFDAWVHVAIVQDGDLGTRDLYVDGQLDASEAARNASSPAPLFIGGAGGVNEWFIGQIDEVRVYEGALDTEGVEMSMEPPEKPPVRFVRGDANADDDINITDGIFVLNFLFLGREDPPCMEAADANGDDDVNITDGIFVLNFLFLGRDDPPAPFPDCGPDPAGKMIDCASFPPCP